LAPHSPPNMMTYQTIPGIPIKSSLCLIKMSPLPNPIFLTGCILNYDSVQTKTGGRDTGGEGDTTGLEGVRGGVSKE